MLIEHTKLAKQLGLSRKSLHRILKAGGLEKKFKLINNQRYYELEEVLTAIKKGNQNGA